MRVTMLLSILLFAKLFGTSFCAVPQTSIERCADRIAMWNTKHIYNKCEFLFVFLGGYNNTRREIDELRKKMRYKAKRINH